LVYVIIARRVHYANLPLFNIKNENVLSEQRAPHHDFISVLKFSSKTIVTNLTAV
jgi:hypothetical protein